MDSNPYPLYFSSETCSSEATLDEKDVWEKINMSLCECVVWPLEAIASLNELAMLVGTARTD